MVLLTAGLSPLAAQASVTIYNDGRVLVRRTLPLEIPKGNSSQWAALGLLDPATLFSLDSTVIIAGATYDPASDYAGALRRAIGRKLLFKNGKDTVSATVLGVAPEVYKLADGTVTFSAPGTPLFPAELVSVDPVSNLNLRASQSRKELRVGYFSEGAQWQASYQLLLGTGGQATMSGSAVIQSNTFRAEDAEVQLLAGSVNRAQPAQGPMARGGMVALEARRQNADYANAAEQKVGEFHLYSLPGRSSILPGRTTSVALFDPAMARYDRSYVVRGQIPYWGQLYQQGDEQDAAVEVSYVVQRPRKTDLGDRPLPGGIVRLFQPDSGGRQQLIGEASIDHSPAGEELRLYAGDAFDLTAKRVQSSFVTKRDSTAAGWRTWATADYRVTLTNATDAAATIDVLEERGGEWSILSSTVPGTKLSSTRTRFRVSVPANGTAVLKYKVKVLW
ncbi:MAG: hypothetical protein ABJC74_07635 [Gemmatimonadota bacterium]